MLIGRRLSLRACVGAYVLEGSFPWRLSHPVTRETQTHHSDATHELSTIDFDSPYCRCMTAAPLIPGSTRGVMSTTISDGPPAAYVHETKSTKQRRV